MTHTPEDIDRYVRRYAMLYFTYSYPGAEQVHIQSVRREDVDGWAVDVRIVNRDHAPGLPADDDFRTVVLYERYFPSTLNPRQGILERFLATPHPAPWMYAYLEDLECLLD